MDIFAFDTWCLLLLNPWYQKFSKKIHDRMDFCELLYFHKESRLRMHTPRGIGKTKINMENEIGIEESIMCIMYQNPYQIRAINVKKMSCDYCLFVH